MARCWPTLVRLLVAFAVWSWVVAQALPAYARVVVPAASALLELVRPHGVGVELLREGGYVAFRFAVPGRGGVSGQFSFALLTYNAVLYLTVLSAVPGPPLRWRLRFLAMAAPAAFLLHVADLMMAVESQVLSAVQEEHFDFLHDFGLWFSTVKVYNFLSIMAVRQVVLLGVYYLQWRFLPWREVAGPPAGTNSLAE